MRARPAVLFTCALAAACRRSTERPRDALPPAEATAPAKAEKPPAPTAGDDLAAFLRARYTKYEHLVPMRDGARLFTNVYVPKDHARPHPILLLRTPYGIAPYGEDEYPKFATPRERARFTPSEELLRDGGYVFAAQDVRGRMMSEGTFVDMRPVIGDKRGPKDVDESTDAWDTIDWLVKNVPANDGRVATWGVSYPGFYAAQAAIDAHPALVAVSPQAPVTDWFEGDDFHHNGALFLADSFGFLWSFGKPRPEPVRTMTWGFEYGTPDLYSFFLRLGPLSNVNERHFKGQIPFWNEMMQHDTKDAYWKARDPRPYYRRVKPAVIVVGGLFDAEDLWGTLATYRAFETQSPGGDVTLVLGPWAHGDWARTDGESLGDVHFGQKTAAWFREHVEASFFERHLRGNGKAGKSAEATVFETGTDEWRGYEVWPPRDAKKATLCFHEGGGLGVRPPTSEGADTYVADPRKPVPAVETFDESRLHEYMIADQRFAARRPDVLTYTTSPLDADVALAGPIEASLWVATTGTDADFVVKVIDAYPDDRPPPDPNPRGVAYGGYEQLVRAEVMRGRFRNGLDRPEPFVPGAPTRVSFALPDVSHAFRRGHRIVVQIQSSWFPLVDRNPQTFVRIPDAKESDFRAATQTIFRSPDRASGITVSVLRGSLPE